MALVEGDQTYDAHRRLMPTRGWTTRSSRRRALPGGCVGLWSHHKARIGGGDVKALWPRSALAAASSAAKRKDGSIVAAYRERRTCERMDVITLPCPPWPPGVPPASSTARSGYRAVAESSGAPDAAL